MAVEIIGGQVWFHGYVVADLKEEAPPSIVADFREWLGDYEAFQVWRNTIDPE